MQVSGIKRVQVRYLESTRYPQHNDPRTWAFDTDLPVEIGSRVLVPGNINYPGDQLATVVNLESMYGGPVKWIKALLEPEDLCQIKTWDPLTEKAVQCEQLKDHRPKAHTNGQMIWAWINLPPS